MTRGARIALSIVAWLPILLGAQLVLAGIIDIYMVTAGGVSPGEPMGMDALAYPLPEAILEGTVGLGLIALGALGRTYVSRRGRAAS